MPGCALRMCNEDVRPEAVISLDGSSKSNEVSVPGTECVWGEW